MWVFRDEVRRVDVRAALEQGQMHWRSQLDRKVPDYAESLDLLIGIGELESALVDWLIPEQESCSGATEALCCIVLSCAHLFRAGTRGERPEPQWVRAKETLGAFESLRQTLLPDQLELRTPEGFAYYGLHPETYAAAAERFARDLAPGRALCIGLRSIGTTLSAVVTAELEAQGWAVRRDTLRPKGDPWSREIRLAPTLSRAWTPWRDAHCLIVDEGPGLSGSSFCGTAAAMEGQGFEPSRVVLFPSWTPDGSGFGSEHSRRLWPRYRKVLVPFEKVWIETGRLYPGPLRDISAGRWRELFYPRDAEYPAVQPYHERRKFLASGNETRLLKFVGLGRYGQGRIERARLLADSGQTPRVKGWEHGFLQMERVRGTPLQAHARPEPRLLDAISRYLSLLKAWFPSSRPVPFGRHLELIQHNLGGAVTARRLRGLNRFRPLIETATAVVIDGRMLPHEWLVAGDHYYKTDVTDHHDDHFYPGDDDLAWDVAGCCVEFGFDPSASRSLIERIVRRTRDAALPKRIPFYRLAYLAYRIGYATLAVQTLGTHPDGKRFQHLLRRYRRQEARAWAGLE